MAMKSKKFPKSNFIPGLSYLARVLKLVNQRAMNNANSKGTIVSTNVLSKYFKVTVRSDFIFSQ